MVPSFQTFRIQFCLNNSDGDNNNSVQFNSIHSAKLTAQKPITQSARVKKKKQNTQAKKRGNSYHLNINNKSINTNQCYH
jgi:hypothetical protein